MSNNHDEKKEKVIKKLVAAIIRRKVKFAEEGYYEYNRNSMEVVHKDLDNVQRKRNTDQLSK
ncbi:MAG: hypothetical protein POELPBGB_01246 [Bacteroidia bacterium]|nr:hypothetical protein [Bacteroidia bacterium]